jgi:F420H(2)-dependent quinone reductase
MSDHTPLSPRGRRGKRIRRLDRIMTRLVTGAHRLLFRATAGRLLNTMGGNRVQILTTTGRRTGRPRSHPVITIEDGPHFLIAATNGGAADHPLWVRNIVANPNVRLNRNGADLPMHATILTDDERDRVWPVLVRAYKTYDTMQGKTDRKIAVIRLTPRDVLTP